MRHSLNIPAIPGTSRQQPMHFCEELGERFASVHSVWWWLMMAPLLSRRRFFLGSFVLSAILYRIQGVRTVHETVSNWLGIIFYSHVFYWNSDDIALFIRYHHPSGFDFSKRFRQKISFTSLNFILSYTFRRYPRNVPSSNYSKPISPDIWQPIMCPVFSMPHFILSSVMYVKYYCVGDTW